MTTISIARLVQAVHSPAEISLPRLNCVIWFSSEQISPNEVMAVFESWAKSLDARELDLKSRGSSSFGCG